MQTRIDQHHVVESVEDSVDALLSKLEGKGKKIKIRTEEEEEAERERLAELEREKTAEMERVLAEKERLDNDKAVVENELQAKQEMLDNELNEIEALEAMMNELNNKLTMGGQQLQEKEAEQLAAKREY